MRPARPGLIARFRDDRRGAMAVLAAGSIAVAGALAAFAVDLGSINLAKRRAQQTADLAALAGAAQIGEARQVAGLSVRENGIVQPDRLDVRVGTYEADPALAVGSRFVEGAGPRTNAVRVALETRARLYFGKLLGTGSEVPIRVEATAATSRSGAFSIGSRLARLDGGVLNGILTALTGSSVNLTVMDYQALASTRVDLFRTMGALATELDIEAGTFDRVLRAQTSSAALARAIRTGTTDARARSALQTLGLQLGSAAAVRASLDRLIDLGPYRFSPLDEPPAIDVAVSALDLMMAHAQVANGSRIVDAGLAISLPGIASVRLYLFIGERPQSAHWLTIGPEGATVHTAQTRLLLDIRLLGSGLLGAAQVRLPIYLELAPADARLSRVTCGRQRSDLRVVVDARSGIVDAWIGDVTPALMTNVTAPVSPGPAELVRLPLVKITGRAHVTMRNDAYQPLAFGADDIDRRLPKTVRTSSYTTSLTQGLLRDLTLRPEVVGLPLIDVGLLTNALPGLLAGVTPSVDQLLDAVLQTLGLSLGEADVWVYAARCDGSVLVQ